MLGVEPYSSFSYASLTNYSLKALTQFRGFSVVQGLQRSLGALVQFRGFSEFRGSSVLLTLSVQPTQLLAYSLGALILQYVYFSVQLSPLFTSLSLLFTSCLLAPCISQLPSFYSSSQLPLASDFFVYKQLLILFLELIFIEFNNSFPTTFALIVPFQRSPLQSVDYRQPPQTTNQLLVVAYSIISLLQLSKGRGPILYKIKSL